MNTQITHYRMVVIAIAMLLSFTSCKKDKKDPEPTPVEMKTITITELRALSTGTSIIPDGRKIKGIVISDAAGKNIDSKTMVLQEANDKAGIVVTFDAAPTFAVNDEVELTISNQTVTQVNGEIVLQNIPAANAKKTGTGAITARATTIANIVTNKAIWEGTLVSIDASDLISANGKYEGNLKIKDASGELSSTVLTSATFKGTVLPLSVNKATGIVRLNGPEVRLDIRTQNDVVAGDLVKVVSEDFSTWLDADPGTSELQTSLIHWFGNPSNTGAIKYNGLAADAGFTNVAKTYPYLLNNYDSFVDPSLGAYLSAEGSSSDLKGVKLIKVTFAGSKVTGKGQFPNVLSPFYNGTNPNFVNQLDYQAFNPATDVLKLGLIIFVADKEFLITESAEYKEAGKFFTVTLKVPTTYTEVLTLTKNEVSETVAFRWTEEPIFKIVNLSSGNPAGADFKVKQRPIIIDKVELGF